MPATLADIVSDAQGIIGEVAGVGVQQYGEDRLFDDAVRGFNLLFKKYPWHQYRKWYTGVLDGTTGVITTDEFERVIDFEDFLVVCRYANNLPLPILPMAVNPTVITGTRPQFWTGLLASHANYVGRKIQIYPITAEGSINVLAKEYPLVPPALGFDWQDTLYLDRDLLAYASAYMTLIGDALNHDAAQTVKEFMEGRFADITAGLADHPIPVRGQGSIPSDWYVVP